MIQVVQTVLEVGVLRRSMLSSSEKERIRLSRTSWTPSRTSDATCTPTGVKTKRRPRLDAMSMHDFDVDRRVSLLLPAK